MLKITRVSKTEFETNDGTVHPMLFELDEVPSIADFQAQYDDWFNVFSERGLIENIQANDQHRRGVRSAGRSH